MEKILTRAQENNIKIEHMSADVAARRETEPVLIHRTRKPTDPMVKSSPLSDSSTTAFSTPSKENKNQPGRRPDSRQTKRGSSREILVKNSLNNSQESEEPYKPELAEKKKKEMDQRELRKN